MKKKYWIVLLGVSAVILLTVLGDNNNKSAQEAKRVELVELELSQVRAQLRQCEERERERLPESQPIDERQKLPHWKDWSDEERKAALAKAAITTVSSIATDFPAGFPGSKLGFHETMPRCGATEIDTLQQTGRHVQYSNLSEVTPAMIKWNGWHVTVLTAAAERLFKKRGRRMLNSLDIGALHQPTLIPRCKAFFLDFKPLAELRAQYPDLTMSWLMDPDYLGTAETLATVPDNSMDVVIMSHVLEHTRQPLRALRNALRVARKDAIIFIAMPDVCLTFDALRLLTPWSHHVEEWFDDGAADRNEYEHQREFGLASAHVSGIRNRSRVDFTGVEAQAAKMLPGIHYHTWTPTSWHEFITRAVEEIRMPVVVMQSTGSKINSNTIYTILRRL